MELYFKPLNRTTKDGTDLPDPHGDLAKVVPMSSIKEANDAVSKVIAKQGAKRQEYQKKSLEMKTKIAKFAVENGIKAAVNKFQDKVPNAPENWNNTIRDWKNSYLRELRKKRKAGDTEDIVLPVMKRGRPLLIGDELDEQVQAYIKDLRKSHATVNTAIVISAAEGIVRGHDASLLSSNGGSLDVSKDWAKHLMKRMGFSKRKATTKSTLSHYDFDKVREIYLNDVSSIVVMEEIPPSLIINWDQTGTHFVPVSQWTMDVKGARRVEIAGLNDKRQMTMVLAGTASRISPPSINLLWLNIKKPTEKCAISR